MEKYFKRYGLYHDAGFNDYLDNPRRFGFLTQAALQLCKDWDSLQMWCRMTGSALAAAYLKDMALERPGVGSGSEPAHYS
jgi:starch synthase